MSMSVVIRLEWALSDGVLVYEPSDFLVFLGVEGKSNGSCNSLQKKMFYLLVFQCVFIPISYRVTMWLENPVRPCIIKYVYISLFWLM